MVMFDNWVGSYMIVSSGVSNFGNIGRRV